MCVAGESLIRCCLLQNLLCFMKYEICIMGRMNTETTAELGSPIRVLLCGIGFMGVMHGQVYGQLPGVEVAAVVDARGAGAAEQVASIGLQVPVFTTLAEALAAVDVDIIDVCLPTDLHEAFVVEAAKSGKAIFCEKPLSIETESAARMVTAVEAAGVPFQVGHCIRFWPEYELLRDLVAGKRESVGALKSLTLQRRSGRPGYSVGNWLNDAKRSRGAALDLHIHDTDFILSLLGTPTTVTSRGNIVSGALDHLFTTYGYDGVAVVAEGGWDYPAKWGFQMAYQAIFENGTLDYDSRATPALVLTLNDADPVPLAVAADEVGQSAVDLGNVSSLGGYFRELRYFVECIRKGEHPTQATGPQALESLRVVEAEIESALCGRTVTL